VTEVSVGIADVDFARPERYPVGVYRSATMSNMTLSIEGMHCGGCVRRVTAQLQKVPGVQVQDVAVGSAKLAYDPQQASPETVVGALERIGFKAAVTGGGDQ
jgi:copper chaperone CopZ